MMRCKVISVFTIAIALIGWVVLCIVIGQEFLKSIEDGQTSTSANEGHTTVVHPTTEPTKDVTAQTRTSEITELVTPSPGCGKRSTKKHDITPAFTQPLTRKTDGSGEGPATTTLNANVPQNELTTQKLASNDSGPTSTIENPASSPPIASPGSNDAGISGNDPSLVTGKVVVKIHPSDIHKPIGYMVLIHPFVAFWRMFDIMVEVLQ